MCTPRLPVVDWTDTPCRYKWTRPFRTKDEIWFLRVCNHILNAVYVSLLPAAPTIFSLCSLLSFFKVIIRNSPLCTKLEIRKEWKKFKVLQFYPFGGGFRRLLNSIPCGSGSDLDVSEKKNLLRLRGTEPQFLVYPAHSLVTIPAELSGPSFSSYGVRKVLKIWLLYYRKHWLRPWFAFWHWQDFFIISVISVVVFRNREVNRNVILKFSSCLTENTHSFITKAILV